MGINKGATNPYPVLQDVPSEALSDGARSGTGGGDMDVWNSQRGTLLNKLVLSTYSNESEYSLPTGVAGSAYPSDTTSYEEWLSTAAQGYLRGGGGSILSGTMEILRGGEILSSKSVEDRYNITTSPPDGVELGEDSVSTGEPVLRFTPESGFSLEETGLTTGFTIVNVEYGTISGTVTDYNGDPVVSERVILQLQSTGESVKVFTGPLGDYSISGPGGEAVNLSVPGANIQTSTNLQSLSTETLNAQYSGLELTLELPNGSKSSNSPVILDTTGVSGQTDGNGKITFTKVPVLTNVSITIYDEINKSINSGGQGVLTEDTITFGVGFQGFIRETDGAEIRNVNVRVVKGEDEYRSKSSSEGEYALGSPEVGEVSLVVARDDRRYQTKRVREVVESGDVILRDVELQERQNIGNSN